MSPATLFYKFMKLQFNSMKKQYRYFPVIIFFTNLVLYSLFNYGGIRSPDSEIVFRTTQSLTLRNEFAVPEPINYRNFGLSPGTDNKRYSIFGPAESIIAVPLLEFAYFLEKNNLVIDSNYIPISFHVMINNTLAGMYFIEGKRPPNMEGQYVRFIASFFNSIIGALSGVFFYFVLLRLTRSKIIGLYSTFIYSFGSLIFPYTGTFFSEPLCTMFMILSFLFIIKNETLYEKVPHTGKNYFYSGLFLGLAIVTHISAVLSVPFYYAFILGQTTKEKVSIKAFRSSGLYFTGGLIIFCGLLLYYNYARFGDVFETGRSVQLINYAYYSNPLSGMYGLLLSPGKGFFIYTPVVLLSIIFWKSFHKYYPHLSITVLAMIIIRIFFIASRSDWHGGFCIGPRYFVIIMPFLFIPIALGLKDILIKRNLKQFVAFGIFSFICIAQQIFFSVGEVFSYLHTIHIQQKEHGIDVFLHNYLYLKWGFSPAIFLLNYKTGSFLLKFISTNNYFLWFLMVIFFLIIFLKLSFSAYKSYNIDQSVLLSTKVLSKV